jgi:hypothetical protein
MIALTTNYGPPPCRTSTPDQEDAERAATLLEDAQWHGARLRDMRLAARLTTADMAAIRVPGRPETAYCVEDDFIVAELGDPDENYDALFAEYATLIALAGMVGEMVS